MTTLTFRAVRTSRRRSGKCVVCGKSVTRVRSFEHTVNPFNRTEDGEVKTYDQVLADVNAEADAWKPLFLHARCAT